MTNLERAEEILMRYLNMRGAEIKYNRHIHAEAKEMLTAEFEAAMQQRCKEQECQWETDQRTHTVRCKWCGADPTIEALRP